MVGFTIGFLPQHMYWRSREANPLKKSSIIGLRRVPCKVLLIDRSKKESEEKTARDKCQKGKKKSLHLIQ
jgi:hypothetical protein